MLLLSKYNADSFKTLEEFSNQNVVCTCCSTSSWLVCWIYVQSLYFYAQTLPNKQLETLYWRQLYIINKLTTLLPENLLWTRRLMLQNSTGLVQFTGLDTPTNLKSYFCVNINEVCKIICGSAKKLKIMKFSVRSCMYLAGQPNGSSKSTPSFDTL